MSAEGERGGETACIGLGANLGDRLERLAFGLDELAAAGVEIEAVSSVWDTPPWGEPPPGAAEPPRYANAAARVRSGLGPLGLLRLCKRVEAAAGRDPRAPRNAPRPLDLDLLLAGARTHEGGGLELPHPRMHLRAFVLLPLSEVAPDAVHPRLGRSVRELLRGVDASDIAPLAARGWWPRP